MATGFDLNVCCGCGTPLAPDDFDGVCAACDDDGCPKDDPDCLGDAESCHDACVPPLPEAPEAVGVLGAGGLSCCPSDACGAPLRVDFERSDLTHAPQRLVVACTRCNYRYARLAPSNADGWHWMVSDVRCRLCGFTATTVYPMAADDSALECASCHHATAEATLGADDDQPDDGDPLVPARR